MDNPSWYDAIRASYQCLPCFANAASDDEEHENNSRPSRRLAPLLADSTGSSSEDAETVSLHSNMGDRSGRKQTRKRKKKRNLNISLFGYNLFGAPRGAIHLPDDDGEDLISSARPRRLRRTLSGSSSSPSRLTFDSDASQLDAADLDELTPDELRRRAREAEDERAAKEERKKRKREKKEMKRLAAALAAGGDDFEGFQGSGDSPSARVPTSPAGVEYRGIPSPLLRPPTDDDDEQDGVADMDGRLYAQRRTSAAGESNSGSSRRSGGSGSSYSNPVPRPSRSKKSKSSSSRSTRTDESPSLASPSSALGRLQIPPSSPLSSKDGAFPSPGLGGGGGGLNSGRGRGGAFLATTGDGGEL